MSDYEVRDTVSENNERLAGLRAASLVVFLGYPHPQAGGEGTLAWDRLRALCIDYQVVPPTADQILKSNSGLVWKDDGGEAYRALKEKLGFMGDRIEHIVRMPDGRLVDLAAGCFIN